MQNHDQVLIAIRRIIRAVDLHSRRLAQRSGLTGPQLLVMQAIAAHALPTSGEVSREVSLSQATVTTILDRLERNGYIQRIRSESDKRKVHLRLTEGGQRLLDAAPTPLQESFIDSFDKLKDWEQHLIISSLERVVEMMDAQDLDAAPLLTTQAPNGELNPSSVRVEGVGPPTAAANGEGRKVRRRATEESAGEKAKA